MGLANSIVWRIAAKKAPARLAAGLLLLAGCCGTAAAQPLARSADPEASVVDELVVRARLPGPAWWTIRKGDSTVWLLGVPTGEPKGLAWNDRVLAGRLDGANALILPPDVRLSPLKALAYFVTHRGAFRSRGPLEQGLPPDIANRFAAARMKLGKSASRYAGWRPLVAGMILDGDVRTAARMQTEQPRDHIRALGRKAHVREQPITAYDLGPLLKVLGAMSDQAHIECLRDALDQAEAGPEGLEAASRAWADGDVRGALEAERGSDRCLAALPDVAALLIRRQAETADAIKLALATPGHAVAVVELRSLLAKDGVLDRLRAEGFVVGTPDRDR
jgi:uncharacterized protein YbaP (TraB family)